jgi:hypothetical protein
MRFFRPFFHSSFSSEPLQFLLRTLDISSSSPTEVVACTARSLPAVHSLLHSSLVDHFKKLSTTFSKSASLVPLFLNGLPNPAGPGVPGKRTWFRDPPDMTWLPALGKFLPDSWCDDSNIADKAVKADDDAVPVHLWNKRIELVIPTTTNQRGFHTLALIWQRKYMYRPFRGYLASRHGPDWNSLLIAARQQTARVARAVIEPPPRKRARGGEEVTTTDPSKAEIPVIPVGVVPNTEVNTDVPVTDATRPTISRADLQLHLDADAGCQVMNRCFGGQ